MINIFSMNLSHVDFMIIKIKGLERAHLLVAHVGVDLNKLQNNTFLSYKMLESISKLYHTIQEKSCRV